MGRTCRHWADIRGDRYDLDSGHCAANGREAKRTAEEVAKPKLEVVVEEDGEGCLRYITTNIRQVPIWIRKIEFELFVITEKLGHKKFVQGGWFGLRSVPAEGLPRKLEPGEAIEIYWTKKWFEEWMEKEKEAFLKYLSMGTTLRDVLINFIKKYFFGGFYFASYQQMKSPNYRIRVHTYDTTNQSHICDFYYNTKWGKLESNAMNLGVSIEVKEENQKEVMAEVTTEQLLAERNRLLEILEKRDPELKAEIEKELKGRN